MRTKRRSANINSSSITTPTPTRRPISSPVRSTTYVLQQHHRLPNNNNNNSTNTTSKKTFSSSPVQSPPSQQQQTPMTLKKTRQTQQQRVYSNHERLHQQTPSTVNSIATPRTPIALTPRRTSPIVKSTPTKTTPTFISRSPRVRERKESDTNEKMTNFMFFFLSVSWIFNKYFDLRLLFWQSRFRIHHRYDILGRLHHHHHHHCPRFNHVHHALHFVLLNSQPQTTNLLVSIQPYRNLLNHYDP